MFLLEPDIFVWDLAILLLISGGLMLFFLSRLWIKRNPLPCIGKLLVGLLGIVGLLGSLLTIYGSFIEPQILVTTRATVSFPFSQPLRIAVISDLHVGPYTGKAFIQRVVDRVNNTLPDMVLIAGDFLFTPESSQEGLDPLSELRAPLGVFAVMGNHDMGRYQTLTGKKKVLEDKTDELSALLTRERIIVLQNQSQLITLPQGTIAIAGVDDLWSDKADLGATLKGIPDDVPVILLTHNPDIILDPRSHRASLIVAGHTHGGQFRLPFIGAIAPIPTRTGKKYDQGVFLIDKKTTLAITRGIGETLARARLFAWPEVMVLETQR